MDYKEAMIELEKAHADNPALLEALRNHNSNKNDDLKTLNAKVTDMEANFSKSNEAMTKMTEMIEGFGKSVGKDIKVNPEDLAQNGVNDASVLTKELNDLRETVLGLKEASKEEAAKSVNLKRKNEIAEALEGVGILPKYMDGQAKLLALDFDYTEGGVLANKDGVKLSDAVSKVVEEYPEYIKNTMTGDVDVKAPNGGNSDNGIDPMVADAVAKARQSL